MTLDDTVRGVASGPGLVGCGFAAHAAHVTGVDLTPAMLERARALAAEGRPTGSADAIRQMFRHAVTGGAMRMDTASRTDACASPVAMSS